MSILGSYKEDMAEHQTPVLGHLAMWSVNGELSWVKHDEFEKLVTETSAPVNVPPLPRGHDVFRRACTESQKSYRKIPGDDNSKINVLVRSAGHDEECIYQEVIIEVLDTDNHRLSFEPVGRIVYHRVGGRIDYEVMTENDLADRVVSDVREYYKQKYVYLNPNAVRFALMTALETTLCGFSYRRSGGVYFIMEDYTEQLDYLLELCDGLPGVELNLIPLPDTVRQRTRLREAFEAESIGSLHSLMGEMQDFLKEHPDVVSLDDTVKYQTRYAEIKKKIDQYRGLMRNNLSETDAALELCMGQMKTMLNRMADD